MRSSNYALPVFVMIVLSGCSGSGDGTGSSSTSTSTSATAAVSGTSTSSSDTATDSSSTSTTTTTASGSTANNVMAITVNGSLCSNTTSGSYYNKPCVSVTICTPGTTTCQTVSDILLDTGSYGLRIFSTALTGVSLTQVTSDSGSLAECAQFGDGSSLWGPVKTADVVLGGESAVQVPIQVVNASFGSRPMACRGADSSPVAAGFNGILGVGLFAQDCGSDCTSKANNGMYYSCSGMGCSGTVVTLAKQVLNPVAALSVDNNGVIVQLPGVSAGGTATAAGSLILGIGTQTNNSPSSVTMYPASQDAEFTTTFNGTSYSSFLDTGSNGLFFTPTSTSILPDCSSGWFCPPTTTTFSAVNTGSTGSPSGAISFMIGNATALFNTSNMVFAELGASMSGGFDWGLPFFLGRSVFVGINGTSSSLGTGPYWAY